MPWTYVINDPNREETVGTFYKKELQKKKRKENLELKKQSREKAISCILNGKDTIICLIAGEIKIT